MSEKSLCKQLKWFSERSEKTLRWLGVAFFLGSFLLAENVAASVAASIPGSDDPNFVKASLLIIGPGDASLFSRFGHASLRMECPRHNLDRCFSYEGDDVSARPLMFLLGKLKMGMASVPTEVFLEDHRRDGRSIVQYELNLPVAVKQELWRVLDNHVAAGMTVSYDAVTRACTQMVLECLKAAMAPVGLQYGAWPRFSRSTIKEREESMATGKALDGKPYAGNPHVRFDEGEVVPAATPRRGSLLYKIGRLNRASFAKTARRAMFLFAFAALGTPAAAGTGSVDFAAFVDALKAANDTFDGSTHALAQGGKLTVKWSPVSGCYDTRAGHVCTVGNVAATANTPKRVNSGLTQFQLFEGESHAVNVKNVAFVYEPAAFTVCENSDWKGTFTAKQAPAGQIFLMNTGNVTFEGCSFDKVVLTSFNCTGTSTVNDCSFKNVYNSYAVKDIRGAKVAVTGCTFENCGAAVMVSSTVKVEEVTISGNTFKNVDVADTAPGSKVGTRGLVQIASSGDYAETAFDFSRNTATDCGPVLRQLNTTVSFDTDDKTNLGKLVSDGGARTFYTDDTFVAQVGDTKYATLAEAFAAFSAENHPLTLLNENAWDAATPVYWAAGTQSGYAATLTEALTAAYKADADAITVVCRPGADVGEMTHGHVADDLTIYGNNAFISGGECDLEVDTFQYSRETGKQVTSGGVCLDKDITITAYELDNLGVWGERHTAYTVTVNLTDCDGKALEGKTNVQRVYISGTTGVNNITLTDCDFLTKATAVYSTADGAIKAVNCSFTGGQVPFNINHKANGTQTVAVENCTFTNCGDAGDWKQFAAPLRLVNSGAGTQSAEVKGCTFAGTVGTNGDILLGDGRTGQASNDVELKVVNTAANIQAQKPGYYGVETVDATKKATAASPAEGTLETSVAKLLPVDPRTLGYATSGKAEALPAAPDMSGEVVNVTAAQAQYVLDGAYGPIDGKTINFTESINDTLILGRASKYDGSKTVYRHGSHAGEALSYAAFIAYKNQSGWTESCFYERMVENVTFTANEGVTVKNFEADGGAHIYAGMAPVYDYVRDTGSWVTEGSCYFKRAILKNITFKGLTFKAKTDINTSEPTTVYDGFTFKDCTFDLGTTADGNQAIRYYNENDNGNVKNLVVEGCTFKTCSQGVYTAHVKNVTVTGSTFDTTGHNAIAIQDHKGPCDHGKVVITGNTFKGIGDRIIRFNNVGTGTQITIKDNAVTDAGLATTEAIKATSLAEGLTFDVANNDWSGYLPPTNEKLLDYAVASIGTARYATLAEAVAAAQDGETVTLLDDTVVANVALDKSLTLDLNGKTVSSESGAKVLTVTAGTITVKNGTVQAGTVVNVNNGSRYSGPAIYVTVGQSATEKEIALTLENMTVLGIENQKRGVTAETVTDLVAGGMCKYQVTAGTAVEISSQYDTAITVNVKNSTIRGGKGAATEGTVTDYLSDGANQALGGVGIYARGENLTLNITEGSKVFGGDSDNKDAGKALELQKCASVVISYSTVQGGNGYGIAGSAVYSSRVVTAVTVENSTLKGGDAQTSWNGAGIELTRESPVITIKDSTVIGGQGPGNSEDPKGYAIDSNSATTTDKITLEGDVTLKANENATVVRKTALGDPGFTLKDATVTVAGGTLENVTVAVAEGSSQAEVRTSGETATVDVETVVSSDDTKTLSDNGNGTFTFEACVARVTAADGSSRGYLTLASAIAAADAGATVTLLADVESVSVTTVVAGKDIVLDLNGKTLTSTANNGITIEATAKLTVKDSLTGGKVVATGEYSNAIENKGTLVIESGSFEAVYGAIRALGGSTTTISGGTFASSTGRYGMYYWANGTALSVTVNGGVFRHAVSTAMENGKVALSVKGGSFASDLTDYCGADAGTYLDKETGLYVYGRESEHVPEGYVVDENGNVTISDEESLFWFAQQVNVRGNTFTGKTVSLAADIALTAKWTPVGVSVAKSFKGTFDGKGHVITGIKVSGAYQAYGYGFFKLVISATVKNVTFTQAEVKGEYSNVVGCVAGYSYGSSTFENVHVTDSLVHAFGKVGGFVGMAEDAGATTTFRNCSVEATTIHGGYNVAGFCGLVMGTCAFSGSSLTDVTPVVDEDSQGFGKVVELNTTVVCDGSVATCAGTGTSIKGRYIPYNGYYWSAYSDLYNHYGDSKHDCTLADGKMLANSEVVHDAPVAIGDARYSDLQAAFDAAKTGDTVTLLSDITLTEQVNITKALDGLTLDGNGNALSGTIAYTDGAGAIENVVMGTAERPLVLDVTGVSDPVRLGGDVSLTNLVIQMTTEQAQAGAPVVSWDAVGGAPANGTAAQIQIVDGEGAPTGATAQLLWDEETGIAYIGPCEARLTGPTHGNPVYTTLADAIAAATDNDTVTLLADNLAAELAAGQSVTINDNGHSGLSITTVEGYRVLHDAGTYTSVPNVPAAVVWVDENYTPDSCGEHIWGYNAFTNIQQAVDAVVDGGTVNIAAGTYVENVYVYEKNLDIIGAGAAATIVDGNAADSVFFVEGDIDVAIMGLTIQNGGGANGGGIYVQAGDGMNSALAVYDCVFTNNVATTGNGGAIANLGLFEAVVLDGCTFTGNTAVNQGGAVAILGGALTMANCTVSGNNAKNGGGLAFDSDTIIDLQHITVTLNTATGVASSKGGGLYPNGASGSVANSIFCDNTDQFSGTTTDNVNGAIPGGTNNLIDEDAMLGALADNGGLTPTHALLTGSPAINGGVAGTATYDQRGVPRDQGNAPDIGAYETVYIAYVDDDYTAESCGGHVWGQDAFATIQAGVNAVAVGGTVNVASGTYAGATITKSVTLLGANAGVAGYAARAAESIINNGRITVSCTSTEIDHLVEVAGFRFAGTEYTIRGGDPSPTTDFVFRNNLVDGKTLVDDQVTISSAQRWRDVSFLSNKFANIGLNALVVSNVRTLTVVDNDFANVNFNAIQLTGASSINIVSNRIDTTVREAIKLGGPIGGGVCSYNTILNANTSRGDDRGGIRIRGVTLPYSVTIANNIISNSFNGVAVKDGESLAGATLLVTNNCFVGNSNAGVYNGGTETLIADGNYWGEATPNMVEHIAGDVTVDTYYAAYNDETGVLSDLRYLTVYVDSAADEDATHFKTLAGAVAAVAPGGTIHVAAGGTYNESVTLEKPVSLIGPETGPKPLVVGMITATHTTGWETRIENIDFKVNATDTNNLKLVGVKNLTVKGCDFDAAGRFMTVPQVVAVQLGGTCQNITFDTCTFHDGYYVTIQGRADNLLVKDSDIADCKSGINIQSAYGAGLIVTNTDISVVAQGTGNDTYCVRFGSSSGTAQNMSITGGTLTVDTNGLTPDAGTYFHAIVVRAAATGTLTVSDATINGEIANLSATPLNGVDNLYYVVYVDDDYTDTAATSGWGQYAFASIQDAINAVQPSGRIAVATGTYTQSVTVNKSLDLIAVGAAAIIGTATDAVTIAADNVDITGFTIQNPNGLRGIYALNHNHLTVSGNIIENIGAGVATPSSVPCGVMIYSTSAAVDDVVLTDNIIRGIKSNGNTRSANGIWVGDSTGNFDITGLVVQDNVISNVVASPSTFADGGRGAYGIIINHASTGTGRTVAPLIKDNLITDLDGVWAHAIGLEGNTPGAVVQGNTIARIIDHKSPTEPDAVGIMVEDNLAAADVLIVRNRFSEVLVGVRNDMAASVTANANYWGSATPDIDSLVLGNVVAESFYADEALTDLRYYVVYVDDSFATESGNQFKTIQGGVDAVSVYGTVHVAAGSYDGATLTKSVKLLGANAGVAGYGTRADEAVITSIINMTGKDTTVMIDGFKFNVTPHLMLGANHAESKQTADWTFQNNLVEASGAIYSDTGYDNLNWRDVVVTRNRFVNMDSNAVSMFNVRSLTATDNQFDTLGNGHNALVFQNGGSLTVAGNSFSNIGWNAVQLVGATSVTITNNICSNLGAEAFKLGGPIENGVCSYNTIIGANTTGEQDVGGIRIRVAAEQPYNVEIIGNYIENSFNGIAVRDGDVLAGTAITVAQNTLVDNSKAGIYNGGTAALAVSANYWGKEFGPSGAGFFGTGDAIIGPVDIESYYTDAALTTLYFYDLYVDDSFVDDDLDSNHFRTIQAAYAAANPGDTIHVAAGTYAQTSTLTLAKPGLTLTGASRDNVKIDVSACGSSWGISVKADDVTLEHFTVIPQSETTGGGYPIHVANTPGTLSNITLRDIKITGSYRTPFDFNGVNNLVLDGLVASGAVYGSGIGLTGCVGVTITGCQTADNAWGGVRVSGSTDVVPNRPSSNVNVDFTANTFAEVNALYIENDGLNSTANATGYSYKLTTSAGTTTYLEQDYTEAQAIAVALAAESTFPGLTVTGIYDKAGNQVPFDGEVGTAIVYVDDDWTNVVVGAGVQKPGAPDGTYLQFGRNAFATVQGGIDGVDEAGTVYVAAGTFNEKLTINKPLTLLGANANVPFGSRGAETKVQQTDGSTIMTVVADNVTINGFELYGPLSNNAITSQNNPDGRSNLTFAFNHVHDVGTTRGSGNIYGFHYMLAGDKPSGIAVTDNLFENIGNATALKGHAGGIYFGQSTSTGTLDDVLIERNIVRNVAVTEKTKNSWGIVIGVGWNSTGTATDLVIRNNEVSGISGGYAAGIALGGNTPGALVSNNTVTNITSASYPEATAAVLVETNTGAGTSVITGNDLSGATCGILNKTDFAVTAVSNWFGSATGPTSALNAGGSGTAVVNTGNGSVDMSPWLSDGTDTQPEVIGFQPNPTPVYYLPAGIWFRTEPTGALLGAPLGTQPVIAMTNEIGEVATQFNGSVTLAIGNNPGEPVAGELSGTVTLPVANGVAAFSGLAIVKGTGNGYTLVASTEGLPAVTSAAFDIENSTPVLTAIGDMTIDEEVLRTFTATATDPDLPAQTLTFSLSGEVPEGAVIDSATGVFTWTPTEEQGGADYTFTVVVTDNGTGRLSDSETITITVNEVNVAPTISTDTEFKVDEHQTLTFTATATDPDIPAQTLTFSLSGEIPEGASITANGVFTWKPGEEHGGSTYVVDVVVTDNGEPALATTQRVTIVVNEVNVAPELAPIPPQSVNFGQTLTFAATATDPDIPAQTLTFSLSGEVPAGATLDSSSGVFTWTPTEEQTKANYSFTIKVTDSGNPVLSAEQTVTIGAISAAHSCPGYWSPSTSMVVSNTFVFGGTPEGLTWTPVLPNAGWVITAADAGGNGVAEVNNDGTAVVFTTLPTASPVVFTYTVSVPGNQAVSNSLGAVVSFSGLSAEVAPIAIFRYHSADYRRDQSGPTAGQFRKIDSTEISRVLSYWRFGYKPDAAGYDGFSAASGYAGPEAAHHSADVNTDWAISLGELLPVQNYWRSGGYHVDLTTADGYAADRAGTGPSLFALAGIPTAEQTIPSGYNPGETLQVTYTIDPAGALLKALGWKLDLPDGWVIESVSGDATPMFARNEINCTAMTLPTSIATVTVTLRVPLTEIRTVTLGGTALVITDGNNAVDSYAMEAAALAPVDEDNNGMADSWERAFAGDAGTLDPAADLDGDTMSNLNEYLCGTLPNDAESVLKMVAVQTSADGAMQVSWASVAGRTYTLQRADGSLAVANFKAIKKGIAADPSGRNVYIDRDADGSQARFYRVVLED